MTLTNPLKKSAFQNNLVLDLSCGQRFIKAPRHAHFANVKRPAAALKYWKFIEGNAQEADWIKSQLTIRRAAEV